MDPLTTYDDLVEDDKQTCVACPTQWEGTLKDGRQFYFRFRHGRAYLGVSDTVDNAIFASGSPGGVESVLYFDRVADGFMDDDEYREVFVRLYEALT